MKRRKGVCTLLLSCLVMAGVQAAQPVLIDVRTAQEYAQGHLAGAINIEYERIVAGAEAAGLSKDAPVALYCRSGRRSALAYQALTARGYRHVEDLGSLQSAAQKLPVAR